MVGAAYEKWGGVTRNKTAEWDYEWDNQSLRYLYNAMPIHAIYMIFGPVLTISNAFINKHNTVIHFRTRGTYANWANKMTGWRKNWNFKSTWTYTLDFQKPKNSTTEHSSLFQQLSIVVFCYKLGYDKMQYWNRINFSRKAQLCSEFRQWSKDK